MRKKHKYKKNKSSKLLYVVYFILISIAVYILAAIIYPVITANGVRCANSLSCKESLKLKIENNTVGVFNNRQVNSPNINLAEEKSKSIVLGLETGIGEKRIYVNLATQTLSAFEGNKLIFQTLISSGKWNPTPTGDFYIWVKLRATRMTGGTGADYYDLPNVPYVMFFSNNEVSRSTGYSLHGAYWHNNFGHPMSHGCINMRIIDAEKIYNWVNPPTKDNTTYADEKNPGTKVTIYGVAPL